MPPCTAHAGAVLRASSARLAARPLPTCSAQHASRRRQNEAAELSRRMLAAVCKDRQHRLTEQRSTRRVGAQHRDMTTDALMTHDSAGSHYPTLQHASCNTCYTTLLCFTAIMHLHKNSCRNRQPTVNTAGALRGSHRRGAGCAFAKHTPRAAVEAAAASSRVLLGESSSNSSPSLPARERKSRQLSGSTSMAAGATISRQAGAPPNSLGNAAQQPAAAANGSHAQERAMRQQTS